jgi:hypothetical protein
LRSSNIAERVNGAEFNAKAQSRSEKNHPDLQCNLPTPLRPAKIFPERGLALKMVARTMVTT